MHLWVFLFYQKYTFKFNIIVQLLSVNIQYQSHNAQNIRSSEMASRLSETYNNYFIPHGSHIYKTSSKISMATISTYPPSQHVLPRQKFLLRCCENCPCIAIPSQESDNNHSNTCPKIRFCVYKIVSWCKFHDQHAYHIEHVCCVLLHHNL